MKLSNTLPLFSIFAAVLITFTFSACSNSTSGEHHEHAEADGFRIYSGTELVVEQLPDKSLTGSIELTTGNLPERYTIQFISHDGHEFQPEDDEYNLSLNFSDPQIADFSISTDSKWAFELTPLNPGSTELTLFLNHGDEHADFETQPISITVIEGN